MATSKNNVVTHGLSGKVADLLVFSQRNGKTIVGKVPDKTHVHQSDKQKETVHKFQEAVIYAKSAISDNTTKDAYQGKAGGGVSAYNLALADFMNAPDIDEVDLSGYTGKAGQQIVVRATDDFKVVYVTVAIYGSNGALVEQGNAALSANGLDWVYITTAETGEPVGDKIVIRASDIPGNVTEKSKVI